MGYFSPIEDSVLEKGLAGDSIDAVFGHFSQEPEDPAPGSSSVPLSEEDRKFMLETVSIKAPYTYNDQYWDLCLRYHDVFSKSKFDIGRTDVIEHKVTMKSEDPIHIRQFRIPLEHRQTCLLYTSPSPRDQRGSRMPSSA